MLQPLVGEMLKCQTAKTESNARMDVSALSFWYCDQRAFFDIRFFDLVATNHTHRSLYTAHSKKDKQVNLWNRSNVPRPGEKVAVEKI